MDVADQKDFFANTEYYLSGGIESVLVNSNIKFLLELDLTEIDMRYLCGSILLGLGLISAPLAVAGNLQTVVAKRVVMPLEYQVDGVVEARRKATISAEVAGKVEAVYFDVDDTVQQGDIVLRIHDLEYRAGREQARAVFAEAKANLQEMQLEYDRNADLRHQKLISQAVFDKTNASLKAIQARMTSAQAELAQAEEQLNHTVVRAPYGGVVVERHVEPGEYTRPGEPFMTGYVPDQLRVNVSVSQSIIASLRSGRGARVILLENGNSVEVERITIHPFADSRSHSFPVRLDLAPAKERLFPGMLVKVVVDIGDTTRLLLPRQAMVSRSEINAVYVADKEGRLALRQVRHGARFGDQIEILAGLDDGEAVALDPVRAGIVLKRQQDPSR
jgi:RND family efflux transporter MFP subunit